MTIEPFVTTLKPDVCSVDFSGRWQPGSVLRAMQEVAGAQCESYGLDYLHTSKFGISWALTRASVHMDEYPLYGETIEVTTWPTAQRHTFFPRQFIFSSGGRQIGCATTLYVVFDLIERKIASAERLPAPVPVCDKPAPLPFPGAIKKLDAPEQSLVLTPGYRDVDMNRHINNTRYVDWFCDRFPIEKHRREMISDMTIHYNFEARPDEPITLTLQSEGDKSVMHGMRGDVCCFSIEATWKPRG